MKRREFITLMGVAAAAWPMGARVARAQQPAMPVVGYLDPGSPDLDADLVRAFRQGLSETGYVEGRNVAIEFRWGERARLPELAADLVRRRVAVIVAVNGSAPAAKAATATIPIVFGMGGDPVQSGLVASINRPGGNITGVSSMRGEIAAKRLGLLHEMVPGATRFAVLADPNGPTAESTVTDLRAAALTIGRPIEVFYAGTDREIDTAFASLVQKRADALWVSASAWFSTRRVQIVTLAARHRVPAIYDNRDLPEAGGLMSYGSNLADDRRQIGIYAGRILKGEKPADLPVMRPTRFELIINLETAKALGLEVPARLLALADGVIE